jgi:16S rRNA (adenine1518-N6/adenine1519-N6)-dimethyltransferase
MNDSPGKHSKKSLGQNFLISPGTAQKIVDLISPSDGELVFEIGPGKGALTDFLVRSGVVVVGYELDDILVRFLREKYRNSEKTEIICGDVRGIDFDQVAQQRNRDEYKVIGNIPYHLTSSILLSIPWWEKCRLSVMMVQKEVGDRILSLPGERNCGVLSVFLHAYLDIQREFKVKAGSFSPRPKVDSEVLKFSFGKVNGPDDKEAFLDLIKMIFSQRRKKLKNVLASTLDEGKRGILKEGVGGVDMDKRPEELEMREWLELYETLAVGVGDGVSEGNRREN